MSTRKVKDAKDLESNELIYFKSHAKATYMSNGRTVEEAVNSMNTGDLSQYATKTDLEGKMDKVTLAPVATSGNYNDLSNKPTIPAAVSESTVSGWGFTKNTGTYSKPSTGIPKSDLASAVQTSLGKADTALQSYTEKYTGTVTGVKINGSTKSPSSGTVDLGTVITDVSGKADKIAVVNHGTSSTTFTLTPNVLHVWGEVTTLTITLGTANNATLDEFMFQFTSGSTATNLSLPNTIKWIAEPNIEANKIYQCSIINNVGVIAAANNA